MPAFHEVRFPDDISKGSTGGPMRTTDIVELVSGFEERNAAMANSKRTYDAGMGLRNVNDLHDVIEFWEARYGQLYGFRWKDWADFKSCKTKNQPTFLDQPVALDVNGGFGYLQKVYTSGPHFYARRITKPVLGSVVFGLDGFSISDVRYINDEAGNYLADELGNRLIDSTTPPSITVDYTTGRVDISPPLVTGQVLTAGFEFDVPVRFDTDKLIVSIDAFNHGSIPSIGIKELRI